MNLTSMLTLYLIFYSYFLKLIIHRPILINLLIMQLHLNFTFSLNLMYYLSAGVSDSRFSMRQLRSSISAAAVDVGDRFVAGVIIVYQPVFKRMSSIPSYWCLCRKSRVSNQSTKSAASFTSFTAAPKQRLQLLDIQVEKNLIDNNFPFGQSCVT